MAVAVTVCAALCGVLAGLGVGSGGLFVVLFVLITAADQLYAQSLNLVFFVASSLAALTVNLIGGRIRWRVVASVALPGCVGAIGGAIIAHSLGSDVMRALFGVMLIVCGTISLLGGKGKGSLKKVKGEGGER